MNVNVLKSEVAWYAFAPRTIVWLSYCSSAI